MKTETAPASHSDAGVQFEAAVLAVVSFPIFDPRDMLSPTSGRLRKPTWPAPSASSPAHFMRKFGRVYERSRGGLSGFYAEQSVCDASRALRFRNLTRYKPSGLAALTSLSFQPKLRQRHFFFDGRYAGKFEVGFEIAKGWNYEATIRNSLSAVVEHLLQQRVSVTGAPECSLLQAGQAIASLYQQSSTWRPKGAPVAGTPDSSLSVCRSSTPLVTITVAASSREMVAPANARATSIGACSLVSWRAFEEGRPYVAVAIIERARRNTDLARNLRLFITRVHAELSAIELGLNTFDALLSRSSDEEEIEGIVSQVGEKLGESIGRLESILHRIGRSARQLAGGTRPDATRDLGAAVLHELWPGRLDFVSDRHDVLMRRALRTTSFARPRPWFWPFKLKRDPRIFLSYRRADTGGLVDQLEPRLRAKLPEDHIFRDVASMSPGDQWREKILAALVQSDVVIVFFGPGWAGPTTLLGRRIDDVEDVMRCEIELSLKHGKRIVPVLAPGMTLPTTLPPIIAGIAEYQAYALSDTDLATSLDRLVSRVLA